MHILTRDEMATTPPPPKVTKEEYSQEGSMGLGHALVEQLRAEGKNPYLVPVRPGTSRVGALQLPTGGALHCRKRAWAPGTCSTLVKAWVAR